MLYKKKPVIIEAQQWGPTHSPLSDEFMSKIIITPGEKHVDYGSGYIGKMASIQTLEGRMKVSQDDFIIKGITGEFYPCKPGIFEATYEAVPEQGSCGN